MVAGVKHNIMAIFWKPQPQALGKQQNVLSVKMSLAALSALLSGSVSTYEQGSHSSIPGQGICVGCGLGS